MRSLFAMVLVVLAAVPLRAATDIVEVVSPGGITAWLVEEPSIPMLAIEARFEGGAALDPDDRLGVARLMAGLLDEGAGDLDNLGFAAATQAAATSFGFSAGRSAISVSATMLTENRAESVDLLALALTQPAFDPVAIERVRAQALSGLRADATDPNAIAGRAMDAALYGDHPFARPTDGTLETVAAITRDDLLAAHGRSLARDRLTVGVVGDITPEELGPLLDRIFGGLPATGPELPPPAKVSGAGGVHVVPFDTPQAVIRVAQPGIADGDPDLFPALIAAEVLGGGGFRSRLTQELREERGLTYGVFAGLRTDADAPAIVGGLATANATAGQALDLLRAEWARMAETGITAQELEETKRYLTGAYPLRFDGNGRIASILVGMQVSGWPIDYPQTRNDRVEAVTLEQVNRVAARLFAPEALTVVVVGQPEGVTPTQ
ncbi:insulinase family protein [Halovulum dunhuangense]|uniref:Insulinase family protein n=1 Tax=Halovulum dunhuangense TaxID=1505036 RepID=A0A849KZG3_9RHOB|nr:insulinase family protein [Halovulum dunhuangense]